MTAGFDRSGLAVFTGPSLSRAAARALLPGARIEPPAARGDLLRAAREGARTFLLIDGAFAQRPAVAPSEIVSVIRAGGRVVGAASLGAIRASECRPAGMETCGAVARLFWVGVLRDDDEVAVATDPAHDHVAVSTALVHVRFAMLAALRARALPRGAVGAVLSVTRATHFAERSWPGILAAAGVPSTRALQRLIDVTDVKRRDAELACRRLGASPHPLATGAVTVAEPAVRYPGHRPVGVMRDHAALRLLGTTRRPA